jgi:hypothetical protein
VVDVLGVVPCPYPRADTSLVPAPVPHIEVTLDTGEVFTAAQNGFFRQFEALRQGRPDRHGAQPEGGWDLHIEGAAGEMAYAKARQRYWGAPVNTFKHGGDVGEIQIRTRSLHHYELIVRPGDRDDDIFVLVTGRIPTFRVRGWIRARDAKQPEWSKTHGGREAAFFVPHSALTPFPVAQAV